MSEYDAIDAMASRLAREEQDDIDRAAGQFILDAAADARERQGRAGDALLEALQRAHQAQVEADKQ